MNDTPALLVKPAHPRHAVWFDRFARRAASHAGRPIVFLMACGLIVVWALAGPFLGFSDLWQLTVNTATTIVTFLMVFLIQNSQNRDTAAIQIKLDELIWASRKAHNHLLGLEEMSQEELDEFRARYIALGQHASDAHGADMRTEQRPSGSHRAR
ncbi:MAG: low affinity iron permease family protein [Alphaproteobacteria bacterium]|nr:low affinity iron permease family protein [Alphaproteobacteria bacterium]